MDLHFILLILLLWPSTGESSISRGQAGGTLLYGYYAATCPNLQNIVRFAFTSSLLQDPTAPAAMLRLAFHDCQVGQQGCDASILLNSTATSQPELDAAKNFGIRRTDLIDHVKSMVEESCPGIVSCADIIALVAREAIYYTTGPLISIPLGRRDSRFSPGAAAADKLLPPPSISVDASAALFRSMGMTIEESVAILGTFPQLQNSKFEVKLVFLPGSHSIGVGHCINVVDRLFPLKDPNLLPPRSSQLQVECPSSRPQLLNNNTLLSNDATNIFFDNQYFRDVLAGQGLFQIDSRLGLDPRTSRLVSNFATNQAYFFTVFSSAFTKMLSYNVLVGSNGEIRRNCRVPNTF